MRCNAYFVDVRETGFRLTAEALKNAITEKQDVSYYRILLTQPV